MWLNWLSINKWFEELFKPSLLPHLWQRVGTCTHTHASGMTGQKRWGGLICNLLSFRCKTFRMPSNIWNNNDVGTPGSLTFLHVRQAAPAPPRVTEQAFITPTGSRFKSKMLQLVHSEDFWRLKKRTTCEFSDRTPWLCIQSYMHTGERKCAFCFIQQQVA